MKSTIIIPYLNRWDLTHARLMELYKYCPSSEIVLVDDGSTDADCAKGIIWWQEGALKGRLRYFRNKENVGFGHSMNVGAAIAIKNGADVIVLLSNDVSVRSDIGKEAIEIIERNSEPVLIGAEMICSSTDWNTMEGVGTIPYLNGWLLACHKDVWKTLEGFDPLYGRANCEDVCLSTMALYKGIKLVLFQVAKVSHLGGQTVNSVMPDRFQQTVRNRDKWLLKWADKAPELRKAIYGKK